MKRHFCTLLTLTLAAYHAACADVPQTDNPTTFLGPTMKGAYTSRLYSHSAYSILGEAGAKNLRLGGTLGVRLEEDHYLKMSADYLLQKITYSFLTGHANEWVSQIALGGAYQYDIGGANEPQLNMNAFLSYAPSKSLSATFASFTDNTGSLSSIYEQRRIAGSFATGISPGFTVIPWRGARTGVALNYDRVRYDKIFAPQQNATGFGGTANLKQALSCDIDLAVAAAVRAPFNYYQAGLTYHPLPHIAGWQFGLDTGYTSGKVTLPNSWNIGVSINYHVGEIDHPTYMHFPGDSDVIRAAANDRLIVWTEAPAVYLPQVLAIADAGATIPAPQCNPPAALTGVPLPAIVLFDTPGNSSFATAASFSPASGLTYSVTTSVAPSFGNAVSINPSTGVLTVTAASTQTLTYTVHATNVCGQAVTSGPATINIAFSA